MFTENHLLVCISKEVNKQICTTLFVLGMITPIPSDRKPYIAYVVGGGSPIPFQGAESFSYTPYVMAVASLTLF